MYLCFSCRRAKDVLSPGRDSSPDTRPLEKVSARSRILNIYNNTYDGIVDVILLSLALPWHCGAVPCDHSCDIFGPVATNRQGSCMSRRELTIKWEPNPRSTYVWYMSKYGVRIMGNNCPDLHHKLVLQISHWIRANSSPTLIPIWSREWRTSQTRWMTGTTIAAC